ncbi:HNH endonuclease [Bacillus cereus]|uniref:HNH endonuclease n=1 Tax=Bacillus cereus TaxID=1396 RepID=UPI0039F1D0EA
MVTTQYKRNPDVIAEVLERANGYCEKCKQEAPFKRAKDGTPYLEVHHVVPLAQGGEDSVENAVGMCPNCHRKAHFGEFVVSIKNVNEEKGKDKLLPIFSLT